MFMGLAFLLGLALLVTLIGFLIDEKILYGLGAIISTALIALLIAGSRQAVQDVGEQQLRQQRMQHEQRLNQQRWEQYQQEQYQQP